MTPLEKVYAVERAERLANWLDRRFRLPGTRIRFGFDAILGLIPGLGDAAGALVGLHMIGVAQKIGLPGRHLVRMVFNLFLDWLVGSIPLLGDLFDIFFRCHLRNAAILREHLERTVPASRRRRRSGSTERNQVSHPFRQEEAPRQQADSPRPARYG